MNDQQESPPENADVEEPIELIEQEKLDLLEAEPTPKQVTYSGQDFDVEGLVRRLNKNDILVPTFGHDDKRISSAGFQRAFVWTRPQMDRFIESLLLGYPIPGIFLVRQADRRYLVLDGQQRLRTLQRFYDGTFEGKQFALSNVGEPLKGLTYETLPEDQRRLLDNTFFQATIVDTDGSRESLEVVYQIFERLNSGGTQLTPHEIRVALYAGPFIDFLEKLNQGQDWRAIYGKPSPRLRDQELILRILALYASAPTYKRPLKVFLNNFAAQHRTLQHLNTAVLEDLFKRTSQLIAEAVGRKAVRFQSSQVNAALTEALFVGLMRRLDFDREITADGVAIAIREIQSDPTLPAAISRSTADEESVKARLETATRRFARA
ncbi:DUF262 domain-containing protein [Acrocarpospora catenulata]|uniref:DUF262 domain-containing protein n=1 Tax=Acrocarpospora catenulata TaxID=2836182 RepID=UPI001BD9D463|nr:DUF262 domain-containing protein [Acrocarpospora catenulata]